MTQPNQSTAMVVAGPEPFHPENLDQAMHLAKDIAASSIVPERFRKNESDAYIAVLWGRDLGLTPMQSIFGVWVEPKTGRPGLYDQTAAALVLKSPFCRYLRLVKTTPEIAIWETLRVGDPEPTTMQATIEEFRHLLYKDNWKNYPAAMLRSRCRLALSRAVYPDVMANVYTPDELEEIRDREAIDITPPPTITAPPPPAAATAPSAPSAPSAPPPRKGPGPSPMAQSMLDAEAKRQGGRSTARPEEADAKSTANDQKTTQPLRAAAGPAPASIPHSDRSTSGPAAAPSPNQPAAGVEGSPPPPMGGASAPAATLVEGGAPAGSEADAFGAELIDEIVAHLTGAKTLAEVAAQGRRVYTQITDREQLSHGLEQVALALTRVIERGDFGELDAAFVALGKMRSRADQAPELPGLIEKGTLAYKARKLAGQ